MAPPPRPSEFQVAMNRITSRMEFFTLEEDTNAYHDLPPEYHEFRNYEYNPLYRELFQQVLRTTAEEVIQDSWSHGLEDNEFLAHLFKRLRARAVPRTIPVSPLCKVCSQLEVFSPEFEHEINLASLEETVADCDLCKLLFNALQKRNVKNLEKVTMSHQDSRLVLGGVEEVSLKLCADPGAKGVYPDIQSGFPILADAGSSAHFTVIQQWILECNKEHDCLLSQARSHLDFDEISPEKPGLLPRRVIDVGAPGSPTSLRLYEPEPDQRGTYITLSHRWGDPRRHQTFCTYKCNMKDRLAGISFDQLPKTFQDAVTVTRALGIQYLWIDSLCIIQPHTGHWDDGLEDWEAEAQKMESYYNSAYCTIAATSAEGSSDGFLKPRKAVSFVKMPGKFHSPLYVYENIDDFQGDVMEGGLNRRGWVFQERALSRRIIHFTSSQTYWECGKTLRCESLAQLDNPRVRLMSDPHFPNFVKNRPGKSQIRLFQDLYTKYTTLGLTAPTDRSVAILGLEQRLRDVLESETQYGLFQKYLHRSLCWRRRAQDKLKTINYPSTRHVPSWSWMSRSGEIDYMDISFGEVEWNASVRCDFTSGELTGFCAELALNRVRNREEALIFDDLETGPTLSRLHCVVLGKQHRPQNSGENSADEEDSHKGGLYYTLLIAPVSSSGNRAIYSRIGIGAVDPIALNAGRSPVRVV